MGKSIASRIGVRSDSITHAEITAVAVIVGEIGRTGLNLESVLQLSRSLKTNADNHSGIAATRCRDVSTKYQIIDR
jgi:hypothetical protein